MIKNEIISHPIQVFYKNKIKDFKKGGLAFLNSGSPLFKITGVSKNYIHVEWDYNGNTVMDSFHYKCLVLFKNRPFYKHVATNTMLCYN